MVHGKKIPRVASASLVLGAMGCGGGGGGNGGPTAASVGKLGCEQMQKCYATEFAQNYGSSISTCTTYFSNHVARYSSTCQKAMLDYYNCTENALASMSSYCSTTAMDAATTTCAGFYDSMTKACPPR